jgi:hypothetical protein
MPHPKWSHTRRAHLLFLFPRAWDSDKGMSQASIWSTLSMTHLEVTHAYQNVQWVTSDI